MTWLVFLMGLVLAVVGAWAVYTGAPIIRMEQGWAEVIAGSVAVSGGVVTLALGFVVAQLGALRRAFRDGAIRPSPPLTAPVEPALVGLRPTHVPDDAPALSGSVEDLADALISSDPHGAMPRNIDEPAFAEAADQPEPATLVVSQGQAPEPVIAAAMESHAPPVENVSSELEAPAASGETPPRRLTAPSSDFTLPERDQSRAAPLSRDWLSRPLLRARSQKPAPEVPAVAPAEAAPADDEADQAGPPLRPTLAEHEPRLEEQMAIQALSPEPSVLTTPEPSPPHEPDSEPTVIGRYQSGASSYTMYSNGVIDVETEGGEVHRFGSMEELKAFIARQENALS